MRHLKLLIGLILLVIAVAGAHSVALSSARAGLARETRFKVRVENISNPEGQMASDGTRWPFAVSPGVFVVSSKKISLFTEGKPASRGLEAQAEDGNPALLQQSLQAESAHISKGMGLMSAIFNMPVGAEKPGPLIPGGSFEFTFTATAGMKLQLAMMFGQSNDLFYATRTGITLFDAKGQPASGDITSRFILWDAGTEINQEPGRGPDQAPRQKAPNTGMDEHGVVRPVHDGFKYPATEDVLRITLTPEM